MRLQDRHFLPVAVRRRADDLDEEFGERGCDRPEKRVLEHDIEEESVRRHVENIEHMAVSIDARRTCGAPEPCDARWTSSQGGEKWQCSQRADHLPAAITYRFTV